MIDDCTLVVYEHASHWPFVTHRERLNEQLVAFVRARSAAMTRDRPLTVSARRADGGAPGSASRSVSHRDRASAVTSSHWRRTSSSARRLPPADPLELIVDLAAGRRRSDDDDHHAEQRRDHREDRTDHAVAGGVGAEEVRDVDRRAHRVHRERHRSDERERDQVPRPIRLALSTQPLHPRNSADTGTSSSAAVISRRLRPSVAWRTPLRPRYTVSPAIHSRPLNVLRTLSGLSSQVCSNSRCTRAGEAQDRDQQEQTRRRPGWCSSPEGGEKMSLTASAPPPVSS